MVHSDLAGVIDIDPLSLTRLCLDRGAIKKDGATNTAHFFQCVQSPGQRMDLLNVQRLTTTNLDAWHIRSFAGKISIIKEQPSALAEPLA
jgi:hypothetical protein